MSMNRIDVTTDDQRDRANAALDLGHKTGRLAI